MQPLTLFNNLHYVLLIRAVGLLERWCCGSRARALLWLEGERELEYFVCLFLLTVIVSAMLAPV